MSKARSGGGISSRVNREVGQRLNPLKVNVINPNSPDFLGQSTSFPKPPLVERTAPDYAKMGNAMTKPCGSQGEGRTVYKTGYQGLHGGTTSGEGMKGAADRGPRQILGPPSNRPGPMPQGQVRRGQQVGE
jgi:hypothetical protein